MASLAQLIASHGCILVLDASSTCVQTGLLRAGKPAVWRQQSGESGQLVFQETDACLREAGCTLDEVAAFVFCEGPGSMLGTRTAAMTLRTWQVLQARPAYRYHSLVLLAHDLSKSHPGPFSVIADARRETWHCVTVQADGQVEALHRIPATELAGRTVPLWQPAAFRAWAPPPRATQDCPYDVANLYARHPDLDLLTATPLPDAFQHEAPEYKKWSAEVHSAASVKAGR
jgi:tRNA threonylcarbamoyladenosine biosynthesis protein TsaB